MKNIFASASILATLFLAACSGRDSKAYDESLSPANATKPLTPLTTADTALTDTSKLPAAAPVNVLSTAPKTTTISGNIATGKAGLNPAHGQPGHRCDIAVGASLSTPVSKSANAAAPQVQTITSNSTPAGVIAPSVLSGSGAKLNPPHGQPGHDCAVEVGKPLKN